MSNTSDYIHGSSPEERQRLSLLNEILNESCLGELNPQAGDKILDLGSGLAPDHRSVPLCINALEPPGCAIAADTSLSIRPLNYYRIIGR